MVRDSYNEKFERIKLEIIKYLIQIKDRTAHESAIFERLGITAAKDKKTIRKVLNRLVLDSSITFDKRKRMITLKTSEYEVGEIILNGINDYAIELKDKKVSVKSKNLEGAYVGDTVLYCNKTKTIGTVIAKKNNPRIFECIRIGDEIKFIPFSLKTDEEYRFVYDRDLNLSGNEIVSAYVSYNEEDDCYDCRIHEVIGNRTDSTILGKIVLAANGYDINFPNKALEEADLVPENVTKEDMEGRVDLRSLKSFTLDCAKRMITYDDALSVEINDEGHYLVYLHVIDVAHYVKPGSAMFEEARKRSKKVYMHSYRYARDMLPEKLSHGICSFLEGQDRLAKTISLEFDKNGELCGYDFFDSVINVKKNLSTKEADQIYEAGYDTSDPDYNPDYIRELVLLNQINGFIRKAPFIGINCSSTEDMHGVLINIIEYANEHVANHFPTLPFIYKTFRYPTKKEINKKVNELQKKTWHRYDLNYIKNNIVERILTYYKLPHTSIYESAVADILLSSRYFFSAKNKGHFKYGIERYTHVNSPGRSFVNLVNQILFDKYHHEFDADMDSITELEKMLEDICDEYNKNYDRIDKLDKLSPCWDKEQKQDIGGIAKGVVLNKKGKKLLVHVKNEGLFSVFTDDDSIDVGNEIIIKLNVAPKGVESHKAKILYYKNNNENI